MDILLIVVLIFCSAFFSGSETGLTAVTRGRLFYLIKAGNRRAKKVVWLREHKEKLIGTLLLGNTLVNIAAGAVGTEIFLRHFGADGVIYATVVMTALILVFSEVLPKTYAIQNAERVALFAAPIVIVMVSLFAPVTRTVEWIIHKALGLFGIDITQKHMFVSVTDAIRGTIELHHLEGAVVKTERDMLGGILDLGKITVEDIMVHRRQIETIDVSVPVDAIIDQTVRSAHSRLPFWRDDPENIIGVLHTKDLQRLMAEKRREDITHDMIREILAEPWFVPETTTVKEQLRAFRERRRHLALVVDEYGAVEGLVTLEDILEEIVGHIDDEYDRRKSSEIVKEQDGSYVVKGTVTIRDLNRELDWSLPDEHAATVGGLVIHEARIIPEKGASFVFHGCRFTVVEKKANQVVKLKIERLPEGE